MGGFFTKSSSLAYCLIHSRERRYLLLALFVRSYYIVKTLIHIGCICESGTPEPDLKPSSTNISLHFKRYKHLPSKNIKNIFLRGSITISIKCDSFSRLWTKKINFLMYSILIIAAVNTIPNIVVLPIILFQFIAHCLLYQLLSLPEILMTSVYFGNFTEV